MIVLEKETTAERLHTIADFDQFLAEPENKNRLFQLVNGEILEKMPTQQHGLIALNIGSAINVYAIQHKNGRPGVEVRHQVPDDNHNARLPDVSFTCAPSPLVEKGSVPGMPDLAVEIKSPGDTITEMRETAAYYLDNGCRLVWLVYPNYRLIEVYRQGADVEILDDQQTLSGYDVMPEFELTVAEVFADPFASESN